jgi:hypothetical protein
MRYSALISTNELTLLEEIEQRPIRLVNSDGWSVYVETDAWGLVFVPDEVSTPDSAHPSADVVRVKIKKASHGDQDHALERLARDLGGVQTVLIATTAIYFSGPRRCPSITVGSATFPEGIGYELLYLQPSDPGCVEIGESADMALAIVDVGVILETCNERITIATDGCGFFMHAALGEALQKHEKLGAMSGKLLLTPLATACRERGC